jgi:hypothetical protein
MGNTIFNSRPHWIFGDYYEETHTKQRRANKSLCTSPEGIFYWIRNLRNDSHIISRVFVANNGYLGKWNSRAIPKLKI